MYLKYKEYKYKINFNKENINDGIYLEIKLNKQIYSNTLTTKYLEENIKCIKNIEDLYNIILNAFKKDKYIILTITKDDSLNLNYKIIYKPIDITIEFTINLIEIIQINNETTKINKLEHKYIKLLNKYNKLIESNNTYNLKLSSEIGYNIKINTTDKYFYLTWDFSIEYYEDPDVACLTTIWPKIDTKYICLTKYIDYGKPRTEFFIADKEIKLHTFKKFKIKHDIKHLIIHNVNLDYHTNFSEIHINKYEILINIGRYDQSVLDEILDFKKFILNNCTIDYLILNHDMNIDIEDLHFNDSFNIYNQIDFGKFKVLRNMKILKGIILKNCDKLNSNKDLKDYCKEYLLDLIIITS